MINGEYAKEKREALPLFHMVRPGESFESISMDFRVSRKKLYRANPGIYRLYPGQRIVIPGIPEPNTVPFSIQVSLGKKTLALFKDGRFVKVYPVGIGKMLNRTPLGEYIVVNREPAPGGPFGVMWLSLSKAGYGIHGTDNPASIGKAVSHGCIRMHNRDVLELSGIIPNGTRVSIEK